MKGLMLSLVSIVVLGNFPVSVFPQEGPPGFVDSMYTATVATDTSLKLLVIALLSITATWFFLPIGFKAMKKVKHDHDANVPNLEILKNFGTFFMVILIIIGVPTVSSILLLKPDNVDWLWNEVLSRMFAILR